MNRVVEVVEALLDVLIHLDILRLEEEVQERCSLRGVRQEEHVRRGVIVNIIKASYHFGKELHFLSVINLVELTLNILASQNEGKSLEFVDLLS